MIYLSLILSLLSCSNKTAKTAEPARNTDPKGPEAKPNGQVPNNLKGDTPPSPSAPTVATSDPTGPTDNSNKGPEIVVKKENPIINAINANDVAKLQELLAQEDHKANINEQDEDGNTALMLSVNKDNLEMVIALLDAGANALIKNKKGETLFKHLKKTNEDGEDNEIFNLFQAKANKAQDLLYRDEKNQEFINLINQMQIDPNSMVDVYTGTFSKCKRKLFVLNAVRRNHELILFTEPFISLLELDADDIDGIIRGYDQDSIYNSDSNIEFVIRAIHKYRNEFFNTLTMENFANIFAENNLFASKLLLLKLGLFTNDIISNYRHSIFFTRAKYNWVFNHSDTNFANWFEFVNLVIDNIEQERDENENEYENDLPSYLLFRLGEMASPNAISFKPEQREQLKTIADKLLAKGANPKKKFNAYQDFSKKNFMNINSYSLREYVKQKQEANAAKK